MYGVTRASNRAHRFHILEISYDEPKFEPSGCIVTSRAGALSVLSTKNRIDGIGRSRSWRCREWLGLFVRSFDIFSAAHAQTS